MGEAEAPAPVLVVDEDLERYQLLATSVAGRNLRVERAAEGELTHTDGHTIFLAGGRDQAEDRAGLVVQGALLAAGSLTPELCKRMLGRPSLAARYLTVEGWRALAELADRLPGLPLVREALLQPVRSSTPEESMAYASSLKELPDPPEVFGYLRPRRFLAVAEQDGVGGAPTSQDLTRQQLQQDLVPDTDEDEETESVSRIMKLFQSPLSSPLSQWLTKKMSAGKESSDGQGGAEIQVGSMRTGKVGRNARVSEMPANLLPNEVITEGGVGYVYPEWDVHGRCYRQEWTTVTEYDPRPENLRSYRRPPSADLRRRLARLGVGLERHRRQPQGDDIDLDATVAARVQVLSGGSSDEGLYIESQRRKRSLAVLLLLDVSGSSGENTAVRGNVLEHQKDAVALLLDSLDGLGDRVALYGFRSHGRASVSLVRVKSFEDQLTGQAYERLGGLAPGGYTRLGAAIRHGAYILDTRAGTERRLLVVLSDGFPYDDGYEGKYGEGDARKALLEARRQGVGCLCISLGATNQPEALRRVFGTAAHANAREFSDLMPSIGRLFRRAMANADLQRRIAQRDRRSEAARARGVA